MGNKQCYENIANNIWLYFMVSEHLYFVSPFMWKLKLWDSVPWMLVFSHHLKIPDAEFEHSVGLTVDLNYIKPYCMIHIVWSIQHESYEYGNVIDGPSYSPYWYENFAWDNSSWILISHRLSFRTSCFTTVVRSLDTWFRFIFNNWVKISFPIDLQMIGIVSSKYEMKGYLNSKELILKD